MSQIYSVSSQKLPPLHTLKSITVDNGMLCTILKSWHMIRWHVSGVVIQLSTSFGECRFRLLSEWRLKPVNFQTTQPNTKIEASHPILPYKNWESSHYISIMKCSCSIMNMHATGLNCVNLMIWCTVSNAHIFDSLGISGSLLH